MSKVLIALGAGGLLICALSGLTSPATDEQPALDTAAAEADVPAPHSEPSRTEDWWLQRFPVASTEPAGPDIKHVVFISVDGLNPEALRILGPDRTPAFHRLMTDGASTLNARTTVEKVHTLPNNVSMVSGRWVDASDGHGVTFNSDNGSTAHAAAGSYVASIFDVVHDNGGYTAMYAGKSKFDFLDRSWDATSGAADATGADNGRDKIDIYQLAASSASVAALLAQLASPNPATLSLVHLADPDHTGHASGFLSVDYLDAVAVVDRHLGRILDAIVAAPDLRDSTVVIVTTDHGGARATRGHGDPTVAANFTVPLLVWGARVTAGADLYALNPDRADPGTGQPPYKAAKPPIRTGEVANLIAELLGHDPVPGAMFNSDQSLDVSQNDHGAHPCAYTPMRASLATYRQACSPWSFWGASGQ